MPSTGLWCRRSGSVRGIEKPDQAHQEHENGKIRARNVVLLKLQDF